MTDRELLEAAARAAGMEGEYIEGFGIYLPPANPSASQLYWQPLTHDGDAFRLAAKLRIDVWYRPSHVGAGDQFKGIIASCGLEAGDCMYAATRRAIVRAAAKMGGQT